MTNDQMREAFEARDAWMAEIKALGHPAPSIAERASFVDGFTRGRAAGMERAAGICEGVGQSYDNEWNRRLGIDQDAKDVAGECADAIRAEIKGDRNA